MNLLWIRAFLCGAGDMLKCEKDGLCLCKTCGLLISGLV